MKVGYDAGGMDPLQALQKAVQYDLEGIQVGSRGFLDKDEAYVDAFLDYKQEHGLYVELGGTGVNPRDSGRSTAEMVAGWEPLFPLANRLGATILNTCFGLFHERMMVSPSFGEQLEATTEVLRALAPKAADHGVIVTMELHVDLTSTELARLIETVDSPHVRVNLDTANSLGLLEDPVDAARALAPYARTTHTKDACVYLAEGGYRWLHGIALGTGQVDMPAVARLLYEQNPGIHLNIEQGRNMLIPLYEEAFLASFTELSPGRWVRFMQLLHEGEALYHAGLRHLAEFFERNRGERVLELMDLQLLHSARYIRAVRDEIVGER